MFERKVVVTYADGCSETYINENLTTPECQFGRLLEEQRKKRLGDQEWLQIDTSSLNISSNLT